MDIYNYSDLSNIECVLVIHDYTLARENSDSDTDFVEFGNSKYIVLEKTDDGGKTHFVLNHGVDPFHVDTLR